MTEVIPAPRRARPTLPPKASAAVGRSAASYGMRTKHAFATGIRQTGQSAVPADAGEAEASLLPQRLQTAAGA